MWQPGVFMQSHLLDCFEYLAHSNTLVGLLCVKNANSTAVCPKRITLHGRDSYEGMKCLPPEQ